MFGYNWQYLLTHPFIVLKETYFYTKWFIQRGYRGYSDRDIWSVDGYLTSIIIPMLRVLQQKKLGYPVNLTEERWNEILSDMIKGFEANQRLCNLDFEPNSDTTLLQYKSAYGLQLFAEHYNDLWD